MDIKYKKLSCTTGLRKNLIAKKTFDQEMSLCQMLSKKNGGKCSWGICKDCGVIPLLYKLHKGKLIESAEELRTICEEIFSK